MPGEMAVTATPDELDPLEEPGRDEPPVLWLHPTKTVSDEQRLRAIRDAGMASVMRTARWKYRIRFASRMGGLVS
jgi:hypothetical protein